MGMHEFSVYLVPEGVRYVTQGGTWKFEGKSELDKVKSLKVLKSVCTTLRSQGTDCYTDNSCIDVFIRSNEGRVTVIETRGCLSCVSQAITKIYQLIKQFEKEGTKISVNVLGKLVDTNDEISFFGLVCQLYKEKIELFKKTDKNFSFTIPPSKYSKYRKRIRMD